MMLGRCRRHTICVKTRLHLPNAQTETSLSALSCNLHEKFLSNQRRWSNSCVPSKLPFGAVSFDGFAPTTTQTTARWTSTTTFATVRRGEQTQWLLYLDSDLTPPRRDLTCTYVTWSGLVYPAAAWPFRAAVHDRLSVTFLNLVASWLSLPGIRHQSPPLDDRLRPGHRLHPPARPVATAAAAAMAPPLLLW